MPISLEISDVAGSNVSSVESLLIAVPEQGLTSTDKRNCARLLGLSDAKQIDPASEFDPPVGLIGRGSHRAPTNEIR